MMHPAAVTAGNIAWQVASEYRDLLLGPLPAPGRVAPRRPGARHQARPHRTVYAVTLMVGFFVKHNRLHDLRAGPQLVGRPRRHEYEHALAIAARCTAFAALALGETRSASTPATVS